jgi:hypothetical protein
MSIEQQLAELTAAINNLTAAVQGHTHEVTGATTQAAPQAPVQQAPAPQATLATPVQQAPTQQGDGDFPLSDAELHGLNDELNNYVQRGLLSGEEIRGAFQALGIPGLAGIGGDRGRFNQVVGYVRQLATAKQAA